ncbi:hypothetical protein [Arthrobacter sp. M4]|uniref:hypothetical protein n=1 Tax=Arthrobacter sp. M4 TaxID=218160 RepID=UPI001CDCB2F0|nr:hypothetical protein [Arthrobacter sp. M4]MCA4135559.1 hypothetical protein [Arthrobacter sp. M4]
MSLALALTAGWLINYGGVAAQASRIGHTSGSTKSVLQFNEQVAPLPVGSPELWKFLRITAPLGGR